MNRIRKYTGRPFAFLLTVCIIFLLFAVVVPSGKNNSPRISAVSRINRIADIRDTTQRVGKTYFLTPLSGNEIISEIEVNLLTHRQVKDYRGFNFRFNKLLLPIVSLGVLVLCFGYVINKKDQDKSILATFLGGHAPPQGLPLSAVF